MGGRKIINFRGLPILIENPVGSIRNGVDKDGKPWQVKFNNPYGYIVGTKGVDGDAVDVFVGDNLISDKIFIIHQTDGNDNYDEDKCILGANNIDEAKQIYLSHYNTDDYLGEITEMSFNEFREKLKTRGQNGQTIDTNKYGI